MRRGLEAFAGAPSCYSVALGLGPARHAKLAAMYRIASPLLLCLWSVLVCGGCGEGQLLISLVLPEDKRLDPTAACVSAEPCNTVDPRLVRFSLRIRDRDASSSQEAFFDSPGELLIGRVPTGRPLDLELSGQSASGQTLGLGRVFGVEVSAKSETQIAINFRKPMAYISAGSTLLPVDAAAPDPGLSLVPEIPLPGLLAAAAAPNGVYLALATAQRVYIYGTSDHEQLLDLPLDEAAAGPATCLRFSPNSRYLSICRQGAHLSTLDLLDREPQVKGTSISGGPVQDVVFSSERSAYALLRGVRPGQSCQTAPASQLLQLGLGGDAKLELGETISLPGPVSDLELDPRSGKLLLAQPCAGTIADVEPPQSGAAIPQALEGVALEAPYDIAVTRDQVAIFGANSERGAVVIKSQAATQTLDFAVPPMQLSLISSGTTIGTFDWSSQPEGTLNIYDAAVSPDGRRAIVLFQQRFRSNLNLDACVFRTDVLGSGYLLLDLSSGAVLLNRLSQLDFASGGCSAPCIQTEAGNLGIQQNCERAYRDSLRRRGVLTTRSFVARSADILFGGS